VRVHVLHVSEVTWGGVVSLLRAFVTEQTDRGHDVAVLAPAALPDLGTAAVRRIGWGMWRRRPLSYVRAVAELRAAVRAERPDVIHLHSAFAGLLGRLPVLSGTGSVPVVYQPHAWSFDLFDRATLGYALRVWERGASRRTDVIVANCTDEIDEGRRLGITTPARALGVPLDVAHFRPVDEAERQRRRDELGVEHDHLLLCLGRLAKQKGQDLLVAAWEQAPPPDTELLLVGPGDPAALRALAPTQWGRSIRWVDEQPDVRPYLWACDLLVLPSRYETVAVVVAEAMACERPVVACAVNGVAMAVSDPPHEPGGTVVAAGDVTGLLAESGRLLQDPERRAELGADGRRRVIELFTPAQVVDRLDAAYAAAIQARRR